MSQISSSFSGELYPSNESKMPDPRETLSGDLGVAAKKLFHSRSATSLLPKLNPSQTIGRKFSASLNLDSSQPVMTSIVSSLDLSSFRKKEEELSLLWQALRQLSGDSHKSIHLDEQGTFIIKSKKNSKFFLPILNRIETIVENNVLFFNVNNQKRSLLELVEKLKGTKWAEHCLKKNNLKEAFNKLYSEIRKQLYLQKVPLEQEQDAKLKRLLFRIDHVLDKKEATKAGIIHPTNLLYSYPCIIDSKHLFLFIERLNKEKTLPDMQEKELGNFCKKFLESTLAKEGDKELQDVLVRLFPNKKVKSLPEIQQLKSFTKLSDIETIINLVSQNQLTPDAVNENIEHIAQDFKTLFQKQLAKIPLKEWYQKQEKTIFLLKTIQTVNKARNWIVLTILNYEHQKERVLLHDFFMKISKQARLADDYLTVMTLFSAFQSASVSRLFKIKNVTAKEGEKTDIDLTSLAVNEHTELSTLCNPNENFSNLRTKMKNTLACTYPISICLRDITALLEGVDKTRKNEITFEEEYIVERLNALAEIIKPLDEQRRKILETPLPAYRTNIESIIDLSDENFDDHASYEKSKSLRASITTAPIKV